MTDGPMQFEYTCSTVQGMTGRTYVAVKLRKGSFIRTAHIPLGPELTEIYFRRLGFITVIDIDGKAVNLREIEPYARYRKFRRDEDGVMIGEPGTVITHSPPLYLACYPATPSREERGDNQDRTKGWESTHTNTIQVEISNKTPAEQQDPYQIREPHRHRHRRRHYKDIDEKKNRYRTGTREWAEPGSGDSREVETLRNVEENLRERKLRRNAYLKARVESDHVEGVYICNLCDTTSNTFSALVNHMFKEHSTRD